MTFLKKAQVLVIQNEFSSIITYRICHLLFPCNQFYIGTFSQYQVKINFKNSMTFAEGFRCPLFFFCSKFSPFWRSQYGGEVGQGEHFLPHKFIKRAFKCRVNSTEQLLNAGRGHQAPRKATQVALGGRR